MSVWNKNAGYGQAALNGLSFLGSGKVFVVGDSSTANLGMIQDLFDTDNDGDVRYHATIDAAIGSCTADAGDTILVMPGHTEAVTSTSIALDVAGVSIIGLGHGSLKPTLSFAATSSRINVTAANCTIQNFRFTAGIGDVVTAVLHATAAQNTRYIDIEFYATSTFNFINGYTLGAANISDGCMWEGNFLSTQDAGQLALCITAAAHIDLKFYNNFVIHAAVQPGLLTAAAVNLLGLDVRGNFVETAQTDGSVGVLVATSSTASTGCIVENDMKSADAAANVAIPIASKVYAAKNYIAGLDQVGTVIAVGTLFDNA